MNMDTLPGPAEHRGSGWTLWREIYGTFVGVLPLILVVVGAAITLIRDDDRHELQIAQLKEADLRHEEQMKVLRGEIAFARGEVLQRLDRIGGQVEELQKQVARGQK